MANQFFSRFHIPLLCTFLLLHGCGGGGSSGSTPPVASVATSSQSATSSPQSSSSSSITGQDLTLNGWVGSEALVGGQIVFTAGTKNFTAQIDAQQKYQVKLAVDVLDRNIPIIIRATGAGSSKWVEFATVLPSADALADLAGSDNILTGNEFFGLNITALTTAEYAEIKNNNVPLTSDIERKRALSSLHPIRAVEQAAMITRLLSNAAALPSHKQTTLAYLLDAGVAETYLEALRVVDKAGLNQKVVALQSDFPNESTTNLLGNFALEGQYANYLLTFNEDGSGSVTTASMNTDILSAGDEAKVNANFIWEREESSIIMNFANPVSYRVASIDDSTGQWHSCDTAGTMQVELCNLLFNSIQLDVVSESDVRYIGVMHLQVNAAKESDGGSVYQGATESQVVRLINLDKHGDLLATELIGPEWISKNYSFTFSANGKVTQKNLLNKTTATVDWTLTGNKVQIGDMSIWIGPRNEAGQSVFLVDDNVVNRDALIKRVAISMSETDWVGRWSGYPASLSSNANDVNADKTWRDGFEAKSAGSWARVDNHRQTALANASWRMERDVVAVHGERYYLHVCQGVEATPFEPSNCYLSTEVKSANFSSANFWNSWSFPAFNERISGGVWVPVWSHIIFSSDATSNLFGHAFHKVSASAIFYPGENRIVEMTSATQDEIEICEYPLNQQCNDADKRTYAAGVEVKLNVGGGGETGYPLFFFSYFYNASPIFSRAVDKVMMVPKNRPFILEITPTGGNVISSVSGCSGVLAGPEYKIPELTENCEVTVNFQ
jgi:hypothetical protein